MNFVHDLSSKVTIQNNKIHQLEAESRNKSVTITNLQADLARVAHVENGEVFCEDSGMLNNVNSVVGCYNEGMTGVLDVEIQNV